MWQVRAAVSQVVDWLIVKFSCGGGSEVWHLMIHWRHSWLNWLISSQRVLEDRADLRGDFMEVVATMDEMGEKWEEGITKGMTLERMKAQWLIHAITFKWTERMGISKPRSPKSGSQLAWIPVQSEGRSPPKSFTFFKPHASTFPLETCASLKRIFLVPAPLWSVYRESFLGTASSDPIILVHIQPRVNRWSTQRFKG